MIIEVILALSLGIVTGIITGLIPGIHTNTVFIIFGGLAIVSQVSNTNLILFITSTAITHTFLNFIPSIYLGAPDEDSALGILPFHKFLLKGLGHSATKLTLIGSTIAIASMTIVIPIFTTIISRLYDIINQMMAFVLIWIIIFMIYLESQKIKSIIIICLAGFLGLTTFSLNIEQPLLPMLTGLFGTSTLINSIRKNSSPPKQKIEKLPIYSSEIIKPTLATILISPICSLLPGLGSAQAATISSTVFKKLNKEQFLILLGSINTLVMATSFLTFYLFERTRTGAAAALSQITSLTSQNLTFLIIAIIISSIISIPIALLFSKIFAKNIHKINYRKISISTIILLITVTIVFSGFYGLLVLISSTFIGLFSIESKTKRSLLMGCILIPTIIFYLPF